MNHLLDHALYVCHEGVSSHYRAVRVSVCYVEVCAKGEGDGTGGDSRGNVEREGEERRNEVSKKGEEAVERLGKKARENARVDR